MSSSAQKKAANTAADTSLATARENNALIRETRNQNIALADPFYARGNAAGGALNALLGLPTGISTGSASGGTPTTGGALDAIAGAGGGAGFNQWNAYLQANPDVAAEAQRVVNTGEFSTPEDYAAWHYQRYGQNEGRTIPTAPAATGKPTAVVGDTQGGQNTPVTTDPNTGMVTGGPASGALDAFKTFREGANYQWRLGEGMNALTSGLAVRGALDSGAAVKSALKYNQNFASNELANYMNLLAGQQNVGLTAANAVMGVSTNATNAIAAQNTNASNNAANAALIGGQANANMWGSVGNAAGQVGGALFQYGMGQMQQPRATPTTQSYNVTPYSGQQYINVGAFR